MTSKIGYNTHNKMTYGRDWSAAEETYHFAHLERLQPAAMLYMDDNGRALRAKSLLPRCAVVVRSYRGEGDEGKLHETLTPQKCFELYKDTPTGLIRQIMNEPGGYGDLHALAHWLAQVCDLFGNAGIPIAVPNFGEGHPDVDKLDQLEELWAALDKWHDLHYYATHEYGTWRGMTFNSGGGFDVYPWRVGRFETFIVPYLQTHGHKIPRVIITEAGCDSAHDGTPKRGWKTAWIEPEYFSQLKQGIEKVYKAPHYVGLCLFSWGNTGKQFSENDWVTFDVSEAKVLHELAEAYTQTTVEVTPPTELPPMQKPANASPAKRFKALMDVEMLNGTGAGYSRICTIPAGAEVDLHDEPQPFDGLTRSNYQYATVRTGEFTGKGGFVKVLPQAWQKVSTTGPVKPPEVVTQTGETPVVKEETEQVTKRYQLVIELPAELAELLGKYLDQIKVSVVEV